VEAFLPLSEAADGDDATGLEAFIPLVELADGDSSLGGTFVPDVGAFLVVVEVVVQTADGGDATGVEAFLPLLEAADDDGPSGEETTPDAFSFVVIEDGGVGGVGATSSDPSASSVDFQNDRSTLKSLVE